MSLGWILTYLSIASAVLALIAIVHVLRKARREPMAMLSWILGIILLPFLGTLLYFLIGERKVRRRGVRKRRRGQHIVRAIQAAVARGPGAKRLVPDGEPALRPLDADLLQLAKTSTELSRSPVLAGNRVDVSTSATETYAAILAAISTARDHVHLEYYIFRPDATGKLFVHRLAQKAREGVEVRLLLDGIGAWGTRRSFLRPLTDAGGKVATFLPAVPLRQSAHINCRNHRKIIVVDGEVAFTGSQNIGDEYRGRWRKLAPWKDTHVRIEGPAAQELQRVFIEDWYFASEEELTAERYLRDLKPRGQSLVQVVPTGPDQDENVLEQIFFSAISGARTSIRIVTPYFVPGPGLLLALQNAALRDVKVEIVIPSKTDAHVVLWAGRSFYQELIRAGVRIYEFDHGFLHSKTISIDDRWSMVGSANMDVRSFLLNFETTALIFDEKIAAALREDFTRDRDGSRRIPALEGPGPLVTSVLEGAARLFSPLL
jgi:cardiolipin synthase